PTARRGDLPALPAFLPSWIDALLAETPALSTGQRRRLLTEATLMHRGVDGLADLAHRPGPHQPGTYLDWIDALTDAGRIGHAADAAREALTITPAAPTHPGPVVLPYLLVAATAAAPPTADTQLGQLFAGIDTIPEIPIYHRLDADHGMDEDDPDDLDTEDVDVTDDEPGGDTKDRPASLVALLTSQITQANTPAKRRRQW